MAWPRFLGRLLAALALAACLCRTGDPAMASALRVTPIRVDVQAGRQFCALTLANDGDRPVVVQVRGYRWLKDDHGADLLLPEEGFQINPTILTLAAQQSRLVRCSLPLPQGTGEQTWRLIFDELAAPGYVETPGQIRALLRISVPVFRASESAAPQLSWSPGAGGKSLLIANRGNRHVRVVSIALTAGGRPVRMERGFYLLSGGSLEIPLPPAVAGPLEHVEVQTDEGPVPMPRVGSPVGLGQ